MPRRLLEGYRGILLTDGYEPYEAVAQSLNLVHAGCFAQYPERGFIWSQSTIRLRRRRFVGTFRLAFILSRK